MFQKGLSILNIALFQNDTIFVFNTQTVGGEHRNARPSSPFQLLALYFSPYVPTLRNPEFPELNRILEIPKGESLFQSQNVKSLQGLRGVRRRRLFLQLFARGCAVGTGGILQQQLFVGDQCVPITRCRADEVESRTEHRRTIPRESSCLDSGHTRRSGNPWRKKNTGPSDGTKMQQNRRMYWTTKFTPEGLAASAKHYHYY